MKIISKINLRFSKSIFLLSVENLASVEMVARITFFSFIILRACSHAITLVRILFWPFSFKVKSCMPFVGFMMISLLGAIFLISLCSLTTCPMHSIVGVGFRHLQWASCLSAFIGCFFCFLFFPHIFMEMTFDTDPWLISSAGCSGKSSFGSIWVTFRVWHLPTG